MCLWSKIQRPWDSLCAIKGHNFIKGGLTAFPFSGGTRNDINKILTTYNKEPESDAPLKLLFPQILSSFGSHRPVVDIIEDLKMCFERTPRLQLQNRLVVHFRDMKRVLHSHCV